MVVFVHGRKYNFEIVTQNEGNDCDFYLRAICKYTKRASYINNLNAILSEFNSEIDDPKCWDSTWIVTKEKAHELEAKAKLFLSDYSFRDYIESQLDEDRMLGEWENIAE